MLSTQETFGGLVGAASKSVTLRDPCSIIPFESCSYRINMELDSCLVEDSLGVVAASGKIPTAELLLTCSAIQLEEAAFSCFLGSNVLDDVTGLKADTLQAFIKRVAASYTIAPYHNFCHAVTVLAAAATLVRTCTIKLNTLDRFMLLLAAICHDLVRLACLVW